MRLHHMVSVARLCKYYKVLPSDTLRARLLVEDSNEDLKEYIRYVLKERASKTSFLTNEEFSN